jgi:hypothetical protein
MGFSKALCLLITGCYFDLNQGGCLYIAGNETKIPSCDSFSS